MARITITGDGHMIGEGNIVGNGRIIGEGNGNTVQCDSDKYSVKKNFLDKIKILWYNFYRK